MSLTWPSFSLSLRFPIIVFSSIWRLFHVKTVSFFSGSHFDGFKIWRCEDWRGFKGISVKQRETNFSLSPWFPIYSSFRPFCPTGNIMPLRLALLPASFPLSFPPRNSHYTISVLFLSSSSLLHITSSFRMFFCRISPTVKLLASLISLSVSVLFHSGKRHLRGAKIPIENENLIYHSSVGLCASVI